VTLTRLRFRADPLPACPGSGPRLRPKPKAQAEGAPIRGGTVEWFEADKSIIAPDGDIQGALARNTELRGVKRLSSHRCYRITRRSDDGRRYVETLK
jgi:hypothetical protein